MKNSLLEERYYSAKSFFLASTFLSWLLRPRCNCAAIVFLSLFNVGKGGVDTSLSRSLSFASPQRGKLAALSTLTPSPDSRSQFFFGERGERRGEDRYAEKARGRDVQPYLLLLFVTVAIAIAAVKGEGREGDKGGRKVRDERNAFPNARNRRKYGEVPKKNGKAQLFILFLEGWEEGALLPLFSLLLLLLLFLSIIRGSPFLLDPCDKICILASSHYCDIPTLVSIPSTGRPVLLMEQEKARLGNAQDFSLEQS